jgi:hypothetical protein
MMRRREFITLLGAQRRRGPVPLIGGVRPSRPTEMAAASSVPSSFLLAPAMKIFLAMVRIWARFPKAATPRQDPPSC